MRIKDVDENGNVPLGNWSWFLFCILIILFIIGAAFGVLRYVSGFVSEAAVVARKEFGPKALLTKYEWFKDAHAQLDAKRANVNAYNLRIKALDDHANGKDLSRTSEEQRNLWIGEKAGVVASFNDLAAQYNSEMAKFNYRFTNVGDLPAGATDPLPRNVIPYQDSP